MRQMPGPGDRGSGRRIFPERNNQITVLATKAINLFKRASGTGSDEKAGDLRVIAGYTGSCVSHIHVVPDET
jgi:hypothetical protein